MVYPMRGLRLDSGMASPSWNNSDWNFYACRKQVLRSALCQVAKEEFSVQAEANGSPSESSSKLSTIQCI